MPVPRHHLITFRGHLGTANTVRETWSFGLRFSPSLTAIGAGENEVLSQGKLDEIRALYATYHASTQNRVISHAYFDECRAYNIGTDGKATAAPRISPTAAPIAGGTGQTAVPWQSSLCITLDAGYPAKGRFGRCYLPPMVATMDDSGLIDLTQAQSIFGNFRDMLANMSNISGLDTGWGVAVVGGTGPAGTMRPVKELRLGRVVDTQRRRRRQVGEAYIKDVFSA